MCYVNFQEPVPHASLLDCMCHGYLRSPTTHAEESNLATSSQATKFPLQFVATLPYLCCEPHSTDDTGHILVFVANTGGDTTVEAADFEKQNNSRS